jgi:hypothetical protein
VMGELHRPVENSRRCEVMGCHDMGLYEPVIFTHTCASGVRVLYPEVFEQLTGGYHSTTLPADQPKLAEVHRKQSQQWAYIRARCRWRCMRVVCVEMVLLVASGLEGEIACSLCGDGMRGGI